MRPALLAALGVALLAPAPPAGAADRQTARYQPTTTQPGAPTGVEFSVHWRNPSDPEAKPHAVARFTIELPAGGTLDTSAVAHCKASNGELMAQGMAACPPETRIGGGTLVTDTGSPGVLPRYGFNTITQFNNANEIIVLAEATNPPTRFVGRTRVEGRLLTSEAPGVPGSPPPDPYTAYKSLQVATRPLVRNGRAFARTPPTCPASRTWRTRLTFTYRDGVSQAVDSLAPCRRPASPQVDRTPPRIGVLGLPRRTCLRPGARLRVRVLDASPLRRVRAVLDGRTVRVTRRRAFLLAAPRRAGTHRLVLAARDRAGNLSRRALRFRVCGRRAG